MEFSSLVELLRSSPNPTPSTGARLQVPALPSPFVPPPIAADAAELAEASVVLVDAPAAVGKTTFARRLAGESGSLYLDLAEVAVGSDGLRGAVDASGVLASFRAGEATIIVDALDEGFVRSGVTSFEAFLDTAAEFLAEVVPAWPSSRPRLVILGRSTVVAEIALLDAGVSYAQARLDYFDHATAPSVILEYARQQNAGVAEGPVFEAAEQFFSAVGRALDVATADLWTDREARTFVGYAPVLAAVGVSLAENPKRLEEHWRSLEGSRSAWSVLQDTAWDLLIRERGKVVEKLSGEVPSDAYGPEHQLRLLLDHLVGQPLDPLGEVEIGDPDLRRAFVDGVKAEFTVHPFLAENAGAVFRSLVCGNAIASGRSVSGAEATIASCAKQPFLWRFFVSFVGPSQTIDGEIAGWLLASLWNESAADSYTSVATDDGTVTATVGTADSSFEFVLKTPLVLRGVCRELTVDMPTDELVLAPSGRSGDAVFQFSGDNSIRGSRVVVSADQVVFEGAGSLNELLADEVVSLTAEASVIRRADVDLTVGGAFGVYPWRAEATEVLPDPEKGASSEGSDPLAEFLEFCSGRMPKGGLPLVLNENARRLGNDYQAADWNTEYERAMAKLVKALQAHGLVTRTPIQTDDNRPAFNYRPAGFSWSDLASIYQDGDSVIPEAVWRQARSRLS